jgi:hypothetical protein
MVGGKGGLVRHINDQDNQTAADARDCATRLTYSIATRLVERRALYVASRRARTKWLVQRGNDTDEVDVVEHVVIGVEGVL